MSRSNVPPQVARVAADAGLGEVVGRYGLAVWVEGSFAVTCGALALACLVFGDDVGRAIGAGSGGLAAVFAVPVWRKARRHLYLCAGGLLTATGTARVTRVVTWDDVAHLRVWVTRMYQLGTYDDLPRCVLTLTDGTTMNLASPPYARLDELAAAVERRVAAAVHPRRVAALAATGRAAFGPLTVTADGVRDGDRLARWSDITRVERGRVRLRVWTGPGRPAISRQVRTVPDVAVLLKIMSERIGA